MATRHVMKAHYPAPAAVVLKMMSDRAFHTRKLEALGLTQYEVLDHALDGQAFRIRIERKVPVQMPGMKKAAGETSVVNEERWDLSTRRGEVVVEPAGMPVEMKAALSIAEDGDGSVITFDWVINAKIPVVGGTLEKFIVSDMESRAAEETRAAVSLLDAYR
jgi:hypothetical protein